jgi:peptidoglycan/LPS O-acetylase OafA/YrhL
MQRVVHGRLKVAVLALPVTIALGVLTRILIEKPAEKLRAALRSKAVTQTSSREAVLIPHLTA